MADIKRELKDLEESLWRPQTRCDVRYMNTVLAPEFIEFGQSGRVYDRDAILSAPIANFNAKLPLPEFAVRMLTDDLALVTYRSEVQYGEELQRANRSSVWRRGIAGWRLEFHQGTPIHT